MQYITILVIQKQENYFPCKFTLISTDFSRIREDMSKSFSHIFHIDIATQRKTVCIPHP
jgi:hypothetical protein